VKKFSHISPSTQSDLLLEELLSANSTDDILFAKVMGMIDDFLRIRSVGGARKSILPHVVIDGKEDLASSIVNMVKQVSSSRLLDSQTRKELDESYQENELKNQIKKILKIVEIYESKSVDIRVKLGNLSSEELNKRISALDLMIGSQKWDNIKPHLVKLKNNYLDRLNHS